MGRATSKMARTASTSVKPSSPRSRTSQNVKELEQAAFNSTKYTQDDRFQDDWFPLPIFQQMPSDGSEISNMAKPQKGMAIHPDLDDPINKKIPGLRSKEDNAEIIKRLQFLGRGLNPVPTYNTEYSPLKQTRLPRDESKMPKSKLSMPEKKLRGYLDYREFALLFDKSYVGWASSLRRSASVSRWIAWMNDSETEEPRDLARRFETSESMVKNILKHSSMVKQPDRLKKAQQSMESGQIDQDQMEKTNPSAAKVILGLDPTLEKPPSKADAEAGA